MKKNKTYNLQAQYTYNQFIEVGYSAGDVGDFVSWGSYNLQHDTKYFWYYFNGVLVYDAKGDDW